MKKVLLLLSLLGSFAYANVRPPGTFLASSCSFQPQGVRLCFGMRVGSRLKFVSIEKDGADQVYIIRAESASNGGINPQASASVLNIEDVSGLGLTGVINVRSMNQEISSASVKLSDGTEFVATDFRAMRRPM